MLTTGENGTVRKRRIDVKLLVASFGIAVGLVFIIAGFRSSITGREQQALPAEIEGIDPVRDATQVLQQTSVFADLKAGYTGTFTIDGIALDTYDPDAGDPDATVLPKPGQQIVLPPVTIYDRGNATLTYEPTDQGAITKFATGKHRVVLQYWELTKPNQKSTFSWDFYVV